MTPQAGRPDDEVNGLGPVAQAAVALARREAARLGHERLGTEHLLLGLLGEDRGGASDALRRAGASIAAVRHKVAQAVPAAEVGSDGRAGRNDSALAMTPRASRALARAVRTSHGRRQEAVPTRDLLLGVLDVEGTASQVLRGVGVDVDGLRTTLESQPFPDGEGSPLAAAGTAGTAGSREQGPGGARAPARCPGCGIDLDGTLSYRVVDAVPAAGATERRRAVIFTCSACYVVLGVSADQLRT